MFACRHTPLSFGDIISPPINSTDARRSHVLSRLMLNMKTTRSERFSACFRIVTMQVRGGVSDPPCFDVINRHTPQVINVIMRVNAKIGAEPRFSMEFA